MLIVLWICLLAAGNLQATKDKTSPESQINLSQKVRDNNACLDDLTSQVLQIQDRTDRILKILEKENSTDPLLERRVIAIQNEIEELKIQVQVLAKAFIALVSVLILILIFMLFRSRRPPRTGSIRI